MKDEIYQIKMAGFEGPFGLLLDLVEKRKLFINEVSLGAVTEDYLNYVGKLAGFNSAEVASFIVVASTLILIKSKSLLPNLNLTSEEEGDIKNLEERLRLYELFGKLGLKVKARFGREMIFVASERPQEVLVFLPDEKITKENMMAFAKDVLGSMPKKTFLPEAEVRKVVSIEEMIERLTERIKNSLKMSFKDLSGRVATREEKVTAIVGFLAMLELVRQGIIDAVQESAKGDIIMEKLTPTASDL